FAGEKIALVLGAEGKGLRQKTRETVTTLARLDMPGAIRSLNVSNAAAVSLYAARKFIASSE
ncbi:MAG: 23S rRNA (guanosine(2251)-2'-O)-methyltransferase RlmB, partial [Mesorhizobium sp.]